MDDLFSLKIRKNQEEAEQLQKRLVKARYEKLLEMLLLLLSLAIISPGGKKKNSSLRTIFQRFPIPILSVNVVDTRDHFFL